MDNLVSVIIPVCNVEKYIDKCLSSVVNQTYKNLEIIIIDDGSTDASPALCDKWAEKDERIKVFHIKNDGVSAARNMGLDKSNGDYICFADSDDWIECDMIEFLLTKAVENDADIIRCSYFTEHMNGNGNPLIPDEISTFPTRNEIICELVEHGVIAGAIWNKLYKRSAVGDTRFNTNYRYGEDLFFNYEIYNKNIKAAFYGEPKYHYLLRTGSVTNSEFSEKDLDLLKVKKKILESEKDNGETSKTVIKRYILLAFITLSGTISNFDKPHMKEEYKEIRRSILSFKSNILFGNYDIREKIKTIMLWLFPKIYNKIIIAGKG